MFVYTDLQKYKFLKKSEVLLDEKGEGGDGWG